MQIFFLINLLQKPFTVFPCILSITFGANEFFIWLDRANFPSIFFRSLSPTHNINCSVPKTVPGILNFLSRVCDSSSGLLSTDAEAPPTTGATGADAGTGTSAGVPWGLVTREDKGWAVIFSSSTGL